MIKGQKKIVEYIYTERECEECGEPAQYKLTFLLEGGRRNPRSSAYGRDDCTWSSDEEKFSCEVHKDSVRRNSPEGMSWCSTFDGKTYPHMVMFWNKIKEEVL